MQLCVCVCVLQRPTEERCGGESERGRASAGTPPPYTYRCMSKCHYMSVCVIIRVYKQRRDAAARARRELRRVSSGEKHSPLVDTHFLPHHPPHVCVFQCHTLTHTQVLDCATMKTEDMTEAEFFAGYVEGGWRVGGGGWEKHTPTHTPGANRHTDDEGRPCMPKVADCVHTHIHTHACS